MDKEKVYSLNVFQASSEIFNNLNEMNSATNLENLFRVNISSISELPM